MVRLIKLGIFQATLTCCGGCARFAQATSKEPCEAGPNFINATTSFYFSFSFIYDIDSTTFTVTMSFGYSIGDYIAILQLVNKVRERFDDAPEQFKAISNE